MYKIRNMLQASSSSQPHRIVWVDVLRFLAIFMVICIHCADPFNVSPEARSNPEFNFWGSIYGSFLRPCVPLFVMITGLLLLLDHMVYKVLLSHRWIVLHEVVFHFHLYLFDDNHKHGM